MKNELEHIIDMYFSGEINKIHYLDKKSGKVLPKISKFISELKQYDNPDIYAKIGNDLFFIEHFEFDCSLRSSKGSKEIRERIRIDKKEEKIFNSKNSKNSKNYVSDQIKSGASLENLKKNVTDIFENHINRIPDYIEHFMDDGLVDKKTKIQKAFFIESTSPYNSLVTTNKGYKVLNLFKAKFFIDFLEEHKVDIDYVFYSFFEDNVSLLYFMDIKGLNKYKRKNIKLSRNNFFPIEPHIIRASIRVKEEVRTEILDTPKK